MSELCGLDSISDIELKADKFDCVYHPPSIEYNTGLMSRIINDIYEKLDVDRLNMAINAINIEYDTSRVNIAI